MSEPLPDPYLPWGPTIGVRGSIRPPGSKSLTNRAVLCAALAEGSSYLTGVLDSEDTRVMVDAWRKLGVDLEWDLHQGIVQVRSGYRVPKGLLEIDVANSGTSLRFLTAALACIPGEYALFGLPRMHERPVLDLLNGLRPLGADVVSTNEQRPDCPPLRIRGGVLPGGLCRVKGSVSSQYLSGLLMAAPLTKEGVTVELEGPLVSRPYVRMTIAVMEHFGVQVEESNGTYRVEHQVYRGGRYEIEPDASAASYFFAAAAISGGRVCVEGLNRASLQGDVAFVDALQRLGCRVEERGDGIVVDGSSMLEETPTGIRLGKLRGHQVFDMADISDTVQTLAAVALFADGPTRITGVAHNRHKESDRIGDLARELRRLGAGVDEEEDGLTIHPKELHGCTIETYQDHRMAMSLSLVGLRVPEVRISNPECTGKTYPNFFADMQRIISAGGV